MFEKQELENIFDSFKGKKVLIIGDVMVDSYLWGKVERISPEAPVPVVSVTKRENRPGGAANVALNIQALGAEAILCSVIGQDIHAVHFMELLSALKLRNDGIVRSSDRKTTIKFRIIGNNAHMLRVDEEIDKALEENETNELFQNISKLIAEGIDAIIFEDYDKGVIGPELIDKVTEIAGQRNIPIAVDPKKRNFLNYKNISLFKPNLKELKEGLKADHIPLKQEELDRILQSFIHEHNHQILMATLSESGLYIAYQKDDHQIHSHVIPAHLRKIADVSGAGDSVIAISALGLALGLEPFKIAALANLAGGLVCEEVGVVPVNRDKLFEEALLKLVSNA